MTPLQKAAVIDRHSHCVLSRLLTLLDGDSWEELLMVARARHVLGSYEHGDTNLFEWSDGKVRAAILEELADAIVYQTWLEERKARAR